jgi:3-phosphoshikimate 1-carboxyvinyltransferase
LLIASKLEKTWMTFGGEITSVPYIKMTLALLNDLDVKTSFENVIKVYPKQLLIPKKWQWSPTELLTFSLVALSETASITLSSYKKQVCRRFRFGEIYKQMVETISKGMKWL